MTLKEKVWVVAWSLIAGGIAAVMSIIVASLAPSNSAIYRVALAGSMVFGTLVALGFVVFLGVMLQEIFDYHGKHQGLLFVSERDRLIDRSRTQPESPTIRIVPAPGVLPEILDLDSLDAETRQAFRNGGN